MEVEILWTTVGADGIILDTGLSTGLCPLDSAMRLRILEEEPLATCLAGSSRGQAPYSSTSSVLFLMTRRSRTL
jgi:hypothetical protein